MCTTLITAVSFGICYPWALCLMKKWETKHMIVNGRRLVFKGRAIGLFGTWIKWILLTIITLGIYSLWIPIKKRQWVAKHTHFAD